MYAVIQTGGKQYGKGKKIRVATYKPKKGEKKAKGHRQPYTQVKITSIEA